MAAEEGRAAIWEIDRKSGASRLFATGLRNPNGMAWGSDGTLWTVANERDELGSDLVPDYLTSVRDGAFYGWPYSYYGQHVDERAAAAASRPRRQGGRARLRARPAHGVARPGRRRRARRLPAPFSERHVRRPARLVEPQPAERLQGRLRAVRDGKPSGDADRRADRLPRPPTATPRAGRSASRSTRAARCWSPTTSATSSGASPPPAADSAGRGPDVGAARYFALVCDQSLSAASVFSTWRLGFRLW